MDEQQVNQNQSADPAAGQGTGEKTFTQEDVNRIVQDRLAKEKAKNSGDADFAKREQELAQRELHMSAREKLAEKGLPGRLADVLNCADQETMEKNIGILEEIIDDVKANIPRGTFRGYQPGVSAPLSARRQQMEARDDASIRSAMGLDA